MKSKNTFQILCVALVSALLGTVGCIDTADESATDEVNVGEVESALSQECGAECFSDEDVADSGQTSGGSGGMGLTTGTAGDEGESALSEECSIEIVCVNGICSANNCDAFESEESEDSGQSSGGGGDPN